MIQLFKNKSLKKTRESLTSNVEEKTREKAILKAGIGVNGKLTCTKRTGTRGFSFATYTPSKMGFAVRGSKKQRGRSMVEMLGVLAIIGVLSIGGIQGYTMAMRRYRANEILNVVSKYALTIYTSCQNQMLNNPDAAYIPYSYDEDDNKLDHSEYWVCSITNFSNAGLGSLPQGVAEIGEGSLAYGRIQIISAKSGDLVSIPLAFSDKKLCETVRSMIDIAPVTEDDKDNLCGKGRNDLYKLFSVTVVFN